MKRKIFVWTLVSLMFVLSACGTQAVPATPSPLQVYATVVVQDSLDSAELASTLATDDYSDQGYSACRVDRDCLAGKQSCEPGTVPNTLAEPGYCVPLPPTTLETPVVTFAVTSLTLGANAYDQYGCMKVSADGTKCLDGKNSPVVQTYNSIYGPPSPALHLNSYDLGDGKFGLTVERQKATANYGQCIVANVSYQEIWLEASQIMDSQATFTVCFDRGIWYFGQSS